MEYLVTVSDGHSEVELVEKVRELDAGATVEEWEDEGSLLPGGWMTEFLSRHHNYPEDMFCPLHAQLGYEGANVFAGARLQAEPLIRKELVEQERKWLKQQLAEAHGVLRQALVDDDSEVRHAAILKAEVVLHEALGALVGGKVPKVEPVPVKLSSVKEVRLKLGVKELAEYLTGTPGFVSVAVAGDDFLVRASGCANLGAVPKVWDGFPVRVMVTGRSKPAQEESRDDG